ncbi:MAG: GNAT family N-acetyltransferase [Candidatus Zixiibacteriota bacterium]|nr:MAG: GNAT family N-acetyltransferase [candidate division Zixibacteria bacterium]
MGSNVRLASRFSRDLERIEISVWNEFYKYADGETARSCGVDPDHGKMLSILIASKLDVLAMNRVIGLGLGEPATNEKIEDIISRYKKAGVRRFFVQLHPLAQPESLAEMLTEHGFSHYNNWVKLYREIDAPLPEPASLEIKQIGPDEGQAFAEIVATSFDWPDTIRPMIASAVGKPGWYFYLAYDGGVPIATGANYIDGRYCWIDFAATLAEHRGKGAQTALAVRRIEDAKKLNCKWLVAETAEQTAEKDAPSYRNMLRLGFKMAYRRPNYIMKF